MTTAPVLSTSIALPSQLSFFHQFTLSKPFSTTPAQLNPSRQLLPLNRRFSVEKCESPVLPRRYGITARAIGSTEEGKEEAEGDERLRRVLQVVLWAMEGVYVLWLFLLPFAPGDPVWALSSQTLSSLLGLSLNFFFILPLANDFGIHVIEAPLLHPMSEGLFNFVIAWTLLFAPVLFTDSRRERYRGSLDVLWGLQMFLTNTLLIPYMAIRLNEEDSRNSISKPSKLGSLMVNNASIVGLIGGAASIQSILWAVLGRADVDFGSISERWEFLMSYVGSERLAYAFIWDIVLYTIFQPWLILDNLQNVREGTIGIVKYIGFVPVIGLVAYLLCLDKDEEQ